MTSPADAKLNFIKTYHDELEATIERLGTLSQSGFKDEALILCLVYIDGLAQRLCWPAEKNAENFVCALSSHASDPELKLIHPLQLIRALDAMSPTTWQPMHAAVAAAYPGPAYQLVTSQKLLARVSPALNAQQAASLEREIWRGTISAVAYYSMRNATVHALGTADHSFSSTTYGMSLQCTQSCAPPAGRSRSRCGASTPIRREWAMVRR